MASQKEPLLGDWTPAKRTFAKTKEVVSALKQREILDLPDRKRSEKVNGALLALIQEEPVPCFLLSSVLDFVQEIDRENILAHYTFSSFEVWLNHVSGLSEDAQLEVRGKIAGKWIDRSEYQALFPIGMGKRYEGTHFVTAHKSPDLDTTVASFWGWVDAFAARVGTGQHIWNLPGGPPPSQIEIQWLFSDVFGEAVFSHLPKTRASLTLTGNDLMTQKGFLKKPPSESLAAIVHERSDVAVVITDEEGFYLGDWRSLDVEGVRQVMLSLGSCLRWFENNLHLQLISLLAKERLIFEDVAPFLQALFGLRIEACEPAEEFSLKQKVQVEDFIVSVLGIQEGLKATFERLGKALSQLGEVQFGSVDLLISSMRKLFDEEGKLLEERPKIFAFLERAVRGLHNAIFKIRQRIEKLDVALKTKQNVFGRRLNYVTVHSDIEEILAKMKDYPYLTVAYPDGQKLYPVGIIPAPLLRKQILGTVSLRDFCNRDEMGIPAYLDVISVIDHHKSQLHTFSPPMAIIADVQSSNALVANEAFKINDRYSMGGQTPTQIEAQIQLHSQQSTQASMRLLEQLFKRKGAYLRKEGFFIDPQREFLEYLHFLYAILDDTDLLTKVSPFDADCVAALLNRMKTLFLKKEVEVVSLADLPRDKTFARMAADRLLKNEELYSLYKKVYLYREKEVEKNLLLAAKGEPSNIFADTKEQNGCCRVGQTKLFASNIPTFTSHKAAVQEIWHKQAAEAFEKRSEIALHLHMLSTVVSAEEVYKGTAQPYQHQDELWIWIPETEVGFDLLRRFLSAFQDSPGVKNNALELVLSGKNCEAVQAIFSESFLKIPVSQDPSGEKRDWPLAALRYRAGSMNSRKAAISPFLPEHRG